MSCSFVVQVPACGMTVESGAVCFLLLLHLPATILLNSWKSYN
jgi:hypothetical protein